MNVIRAGVSKKILQLAKDSLLYCKNIAREEIARLFRMTLIPIILHVIPPTKYVCLINASITGETNYI